ncbi:MAG: hypothetical protein IJD42_02785 [Clostridia bacterium]|nr:hypothetical protein [Clostridia bacterium]
MPIAFQMALAHNVPSMNEFLKMSNEKQDEVIEKSKNIKTIREMNNFVNSIPKMR